MQYCMYVRTSHLMDCGWCWLCVVCVFVCRPPVSLAALLTYNDDEMMVTMTGKHSPSSINCIIVLTSRFTGLYKFSFIIILWLSWPRIFTAGHRKRCKIFNILWFLHRESVWRKQCTFIMLPTICPSVPNKKTEKSKLVYWYWSVCGLYCTGSSRWNKSRQWSLPYCFIIDRSRARVHAWMLHVCSLLSFFVIRDYSLVAVLNPRTRELFVDACRYIRLFAEVDRSQNGISTQ